MGVLSDFVIANVEDAKAVGKSKDPVKQFGGMHCKNIAPASLISIDAILTGKERFTEFKLLYQGKAFEVEVRQIPPALVKRLAGLDETGLREAAEACWETPEFLRWGLNEVEDFLSDLHNVCQKTLAQKKCLLLWMSP